MPALRFVVSGRVQGVGFRYATRRMAEQLNLSGWVANRPNGEVEALARGEAAHLARFEAWLWSGPDSASVSEVKVETAPADSDNADTDTADFRIRV